MKSNNMTDWKIGDRIVFDDVVGKFHSNCKINGALYKHPSGDVRIVSVNNNYENIDATIRSKDKEIAILNQIILGNQGEIEALKAQYKNEIKKHAECVSKFINANAELLKLKGNTQYT